LAKIRSGGRGGRPARTPEPGERFPMSFRATPELKAKLVLACEVNGRSLAQEIEFRLEGSFREQELIERALATVSRRSRRALEGEMEELRETWKQLNRQLLSLIGPKNLDPD
jgi:TraY domain